MSFELIDFQIAMGDSPLFEPFSLTVKAGQVGAITGPSGSGKSTILSDILGDLAPVFSRKGGMILNGTELSGIPTSKRQIGILFQDDLLFPHLNVFENLVFGLPSKLSQQQKHERISSALNHAGLSGFEERDIATLSGGQRSRISLLRTLLSEPKVILLDEPFSKLDETLRDQFRSWVFSQIQTQNIPAVLVTHDVKDIPDSAVKTQLKIVSS
ncbi:ATP-binding cassette domain-containing protein [Vibrio sp. RC27]